MDPKEEQRRLLEFDGAPQNTDRDIGRLREEALSSKRLNDPKAQPEKLTGKRHAGKPRSGSDSNASRRTRG